MTVRSPSTLGRVRTATVFGGDGQPKAALCTVLARVRNKGGAKRIQVRGLVKFNRSLVTHLEQRVLGLVDAVGKSLLPAYQPAQFELSAVNIGVASMHDVGTLIGGFSADAPIFLAFLSAMLAVPVRQDIMVSGHLSSDQGDIGAVRGLAEKLAAATSDPSIHTCLIPSLAADTSLEAFLPGELERVRNAAIHARRHLRIWEVRDIQGLIRESFDEQSILLGSLRHGFFETPPQVDKLATPVDRVVQCLTENLDSRFFTAIERSLFPLDVAALHELLAARAQYGINRSRYPEGLGSRLRRLLWSVPPAIRRKPKLFPLLPKPASLALCGLARPEHFEDVQDLLVACSGQGPRAPVTSPRAETPSASHDAVASVLSELGSQSLADAITSPIDTARAHFYVEDIAAASDAEFWEMITAFYVTLLRHTGSPGASAHSPIVIAESHGLLERAFADKGGVPAAKQEARNPAGRGGMRFVLDVLTDEFKSERQHEYVRRVVAEAFDPLDWPATVRFMSGLLDHIRPVLSTDALPDSPAQMVPRCSEILLAYVRSRDRMTQLVGSL